MSKEELEANVKQCLVKLDWLAGDIKRLANAVENLSLQATNNQVENKKALEAIKGEISQTRMSVQFPPTY